MRPERVVLILPVPGKTSCVPIEPGDDTGCACSRCSVSVGPVVPSSFPDLVFLVLPSAGGCVLPGALDSTASRSAAWLGAATGAAASISVPELGVATRAAATCLSTGVGAASRLNLTDLLVLLTLLFSVLLPSAAAS